MKKKKRRSFFKRNSLIILLMTIFVLYFGYNMYTTGLKLEEYTGTQEDLRQEIGTLDKKIDKLNLELEYAQTPEAIEKIAREKLKMVKGNEIIYIIEGLDKEKDK